PYRIQLAGIRTAPTAYRPLAKELHLAGLVFGDERSSSRALARADIFDKDLPFVKEGQRIEVTAEAFPDHAPWVGKVRDVISRLDGEVRTLRANLEIDDPKGELRAGLRVTVKVEVPMAQVEPFRSMPRGSPSNQSSEPRRVYHCPDHPEIL